MNQKERTQNERERGSKQSKSGPLPTDTERWKTQGDSKRGRLFKDSEKQAKSYKDSKKQAKSYKER